MKEAKTVGKKQNQFIPTIVFLFSISIVLLSTISIIFPALLIASNELEELGITYVGPEKFELGIWFIGLIVTNAIVFALLFIVKTNKVGALSDLIKKIFSFEISKKVSIIVMATILLIYIVASSSELSIEEEWGDYDLVKLRLNTWSIDNITNVLEPHVRYFILKSSMDMFGNYKIGAFLASIALVIVTYLITQKITQKRFAGIIAVVILLQSNVFLTYDTSVAYTNFWILFYLLSLYLVYKCWPLSPLSYLISIPSKALTVAFVPMSIYFILRSQISKKTKIVVSALILTIIAIAIGAASSGIDPSGGGEAQVESLSGKEFWMGFASFANQMRFDGLVLVFMVPLMVGLYIASRNGVKHAESIMVLISGMLLLAPILTGFTNQTNQPYRFVPIVVFFAIGVGVLLTKIPIKRLE